MEDVLAEDGEEAGCFVHALEADGAGGEFDEGGGGRWEGLEGEGCGVGVGREGGVGGGEGVEGHVGEGGGGVGLVGGGEGVVVNRLDEHDMAVLGL